MDVQRWLVPQEIRTLFIQPIEARLSDLNVEVPDHTSNYKAELSVRKTTPLSANSLFDLPLLLEIHLLHADTITRTMRERFETFFAITRKH